MKPLLIAVAIALAGCASKSGVVEAPNGTLSVERFGTSLLATVSDLKTQAMQTAVDYCSARGKQVRVIDSRTTAAVGGYPKAEVVFTCQ